MSTNGSSPEGAAPTQKTAGPRGFPRLPRHARRVWLVVHVVTSVGWLGLTLGLLALGINGLSGPPDQVHASYLAMALFTDWLLPVISLASLISGVLLALGTPWGLLRHRWVAVKFWVSIAATTASLFALRVIVDHAADQAATPGYHGPHALVTGPSVALAAYLLNTVLSVVKPWGLTARGRRARRRTAGDRVR
ncbi:DUF2269 domain-containing protein [Streptomyces sp. NPDC049954]|uniref:DUF2269 domain-containing protein n=1 Tax=Streptomyces sp. NPDC049954 TaxID=3155779 RepID=UPI00343BE67D